MDEIQPTTQNQFVNTLQMNVKFSFLYPKEGGEIEECEDAISTDITEQKFAMADGVGSSFMPHIWANLLVKNFCKGEVDFSVEDQLANWLKSCQSQWYYQVLDLIRTDTNLSYTAAYKFESQTPAGSTFIGISCNPKENNNTILTRIVGLGDTCVFLIKSGNLRDVFPIRKVPEFNFTPQQWLSSPNYRIPNPIIKDYILEEKDILVIATDAFSKYLLGIHETGGDIYSMVRNFINSNDEKRKVIITSLQNCKEHILEIDDIALLVLKVEKSPKNKHIPFKSGSLKQNSNDINEVKMVLPNFFGLQNSIRKMIDKSKQKIANFFRSIINYRNKLW